MRGKILWILTLGLVLLHMFGLSIKVKGEENKIPRKLPIDFPVEDREVVTTVKDQLKRQRAGEVSVESSFLNDLPEPPKKISKDILLDLDAEWAKPEIEILTPEVEFEDIMEVEFEDKVA